MTVRPLYIWFTFLLTGLWSSAIFELGLVYFSERLGASLFILFGLLLLISGTLFLLTKRRVAGRSFFKYHQLLIILYLVYWIMSWAGVLYSPAGDFALFVTIIYLWYTALTIMTMMILFEFSLVERKRLFFWIGVSSFLIMIFFSAYPFFTDRFLNSTAKLYSFSPFHDQNGFVYSLILSVTLIFLSTKDGYVEASFRKLVFYCVLIFLIMAVGFLSNSLRSILLYGPVALLVPLVLLITRSGQRFMKIINIMLPVAVVIMIIWPWNSPEKIVNSIFAGRVSDAALQRITTRTSWSVDLFTGQSDRDVAERFTRWNSAWNVTKRFSLTELVIGRGTRSYLAEPEFVRADGSEDSPHNFLLAALLEGGILKLFIIVSFIIVWFGHLLQRWLRKEDFWLLNFLFVTTLIWVISVFISGKEFFNTKQFLLIFVVYAAFWDQPSNIDVSIRSLQTNTNIQTAPQIDDMRT